MKGSRISATTKFWLAATLIVLLAGGTVWWWLPGHSVAGSVIRVGVDHSPPFYLIEPDGSVRGLAVDVLNEVARRRKIRLIWTPLHDTPLDSALERRVVQLWPLVGETKDRRAKFYLSKPWLESDYILVSLEENPIRNADDAAGKVVAHARLKFTKIVRDQYLSRSPELIRIFRAEAVQAMCRGEAAAALVESRVLDAILLTRPAGCETARFHISTLPGAASPLSIAAVPEVRETAQALRDGISELTTNGFLSAKLDEWSPFSAEGTRSIWAEEEANKRSTIYRYSLILIGFLASGLAWLTWRAWRLKQKAETAEGGLREAQRRFTAFMDNSPSLAFMKDAEGRLLYVNRAWLQMMKREPESVLGKDDFSFFSAEAASRLRVIDQQILEKDKPLQVIERIPVSDGDVRDFLVVKFPFANEKGERFIGGTAVDISEREEALRELASSESRYRELFEQNPLPAWVYDTEGLRFLAVNDAAVERYGWSRAEFLGGMTLPDILATGEVPDFRPGNWQHRTRDGLTLTVDVTSYQLEYEKRQARLLIVRDLTEQERTLDQLRVSEERWQLALRGAGDALWDWNLTTGQVFRSARWHTMLGYEEGEISDDVEAFHRLVHPDDAEALEAAVQSHLERRTAAYSAEYRMLHKNGTWRWIMGRGQAVWDERGRPVRMAGSHTDITDRRRAEDLLSRQARTDDLTGVANRREFERLFSGLVRAAREQGTRLSVCVCDLDNFKLVNDSWGHAAGDQMLTTFGAILQENLRKTDLPARIGGDEFILALPDTSAAEAAEIMERVREQLGKRVFEAPAGRFQVSSSFGVAELRDRHADGDELIAEADRFLYDAKDGGRNRTLAAA